LGENAPVVRTLFGQGEALVPAWDSVVSLVLSTSAMILLVLIAVRYRESRAMKLGVSCLLVVSSAFRLARAMMTGGQPSWVDAAAFVFFGYVVISEAIPFFKQRAGRRK